MQHHHDSVTGGELWDFWDIRGRSRWSTTETKLLYWWCKYCPWSGRSNWISLRCSSGTTLTWMRRIHEVIRHCCWHTGRGWTCVNYGLELNWRVLIATCKQLVWSIRIGRNIPIWVLHVTLDWTCLLWGCVWKRGLGIVRTHTTLCLSCSQDLPWLQWLVKYLSWVQEFLWWVEFEYNDSWYSNSTQERVRVLMKLDSIRTHHIACGWVCRGHTHTPHTRKVVCMCMSVYAHP